MGYWDRYDAQIAGRCHRKHHETHAAAYEHLLTYHNGQGSIHMCEKCGEGYLLSSTKEEPLPVPVKENPHDPVKSCYSKVRYPQESVAERYALKRKTNLRVYSCDYCGGWHLTKRV